MATSPADVVLGPPPNVDHDHRISLAILALLVVAVVSLAVTYLVRWADDGPSSRVTPVTTTPTYQPAPSIHRLGPAQPEFS